MRFIGLCLTLAASLAFSSGLQAQVEDAVVKSVITPSSLVPANAAIVLSVPSFSGLSNKVESLAGSLGQAEQAKMGLMMLKMQMGPLASMLDGAKPLMLAVTLPENLMGGEPPTVTIIAPVTDPAKAKENGLAVHGNYAVLCPNGEYHKPSKASAITLGLPRGDFVLRVGMAQVWSQVKPLLDEGWGEQIADMMAESLSGQLDELEMDLDVDEIVDGIMTGFENFMSSSSTFDLALTADGSQLAFDTRLGIKQGSSLSKSITPSTSLAKMAGLLPQGDSMGLMMSLDWKSIAGMLNGFSGAFFKDIPDEMAEALQKQMAASIEMYKLMGNDTVYSMGFGEGGIRVTGVQSIPDPKAYLEAVRKNIADLAGSELPISMKTKTRKLGETEVTSMAIEFGDMPGVDADMLKGVMSKVFGPRGLSYEFVPVGKRVIFQMGGDDESLKSAITRCEKGASGTPGCLAQALAKAGPTPQFAFGMDLKPLLIFGSNMAKEMRAGGSVPDFSKLPPIPLSAYAAPDQGGYRAGFGFDLAGIARLMKL